MLPPIFRFIEIINNKARHNLINAKCRWRSDRLDGAGSFWAPLGQTQVMQIRQRETPSHQGAITYEICCLSCQLSSAVLLTSLEKNLSFTIKSKTPTTTQISIPKTCTQDPDIKCRPCILLMVRRQFFFTNCYFCHSVHCNVLFFLSIFLFSSSKLSFLS